MQSTLVSGGPNILFENITWATYERLLREAGTRHVRMTYDNGDLEIMTLSFGHENIADLIGALIRALALVLNMPLRGGGSTTLRKKLKRKGLEADKCYWIKHEKSMREKDQWNAEKDPPPDLVIEVDVSHSAMDRMGIYAALGVAEVWLYKRKKLSVFHLEEDGSYHEVQSSLSFPLLPMPKMTEFLHRAASLDETTLLRSFSAWVQEEILPLTDEPRRSNGKKSREKK